MWPLQWSYINAAPKAWKYPRGGEGQFPRLFSSPFVMTFSRVKTHTNGKKKYLDKKKKQQVCSRFFSISKLKTKQIHSWICHKTLLTLLKVLQIWNPIITYVVPRYFLSSQRAWYLKRWHNWWGANWLGCHRKRLLPPNLSKH